MGFDQSNSTKIYKRYHGPCGPQLVFCHQKMNICPHVNKAEYETALDIIETSAKFQRIKALADAGNVQAAWFYGNILLNGGWDESRMGVDFLRGTLIPETTDPRQDPYLLVPRDQYAAVQYHKIAATLPDANQIEVQHSRNILAYCRKKADIGYYGTEKPNEIILAHFEALAKQAKSEDVKANPFFPFPYKRPEVKNPKTKIFGIVATTMNNFNLAAFIIAILAVFSFCPFKIIQYVLEGDYDNFVSSLYFFAIIFFALLIPSFITMYFCSKFGVKDGMPLCSCATIKKAYQDNLDKLPEDCRIGDDAFASTPFWIRNFNHIKQSYFAITLLVSIVMVSLQLLGSTSVYFTIESMLAIYVVLCCSFVTLLSDRNFCLVDRACDLASRPIPFTGAF